MADFFESPDLGSIGIWIDRRADAYASRLEKALEPGPVKQGPESPPTEESLLNGLDDLLEDAVALFNRTVVRGPYNRQAKLLLDPFAFDPKDAPENPAARRRALMRALLAAAIEARGEYRLHRVQNTALARCYEVLGAEFGRSGCPVHAAFAYGRAAVVYQLLEDNKARDRCQLAERQMMCQARPRGLVWAGMRLADVLCGYGYRPGRLLLVMGIQLALFSGLLTILSADDFALALHVCLVNYLNPLGFGDVGHLPLPGTYVVVLECYAGDFSKGIFIVLLVRKWFQL